MSKPNWEQIRREWETTNKTYKELESQFNVKSSTIRSRKNREKWQRNAMEDATQQNQSVATKKKSSVASKKKKASSNKQRNRSGNPNPKNQFTKRNRAAVTHGLFSKYLPEETLNIVNEIDDIDPLEILYMNIKMQFASILRAQQIMFVEDREDHTTFKTKEKEDEFTIEETYDVHASWDKQATFMNSLSRSMAELRNMLKQYVEMANYDDNRLLEVKRMQSIIEKNNAEIEKMNKENTNDGPPEITIVDAWADADE